ncbi:MAG: phosphatase PAP2 family protein [Tissierella sp.]|uniref:phosphatase PAP2 family protein n=1 Tax=Tissierella sp. TaxID=41274 RepID=UPI003F9529A2
MEKIKSGKSKGIILEVFLLLVFLTIGFFVRNSSEGILFDRRILNFLHRDTEPIVLEIMKVISFLGSEKFIVPFITLVLVYNMYKKNIFESIFLLVNTLGSFLLNVLLKQVFNRVRPFHLSLVEQGGLSYPSGHSMVVMSMYLALLYLLIRGERKRNKRLLLKGLVGVYILLMGLSRMYLGVHWPTDIIGGYIVGYLLYSWSKRIIRV